MASRALGGILAAGLASSLLVGCGKTSESDVGENTASTGGSSPSQGGAANGGSGGQGNPAGMSAAAGASDSTAAAGSVGMSGTSGQSGAANGANAGGAGSGGAGSSSEVGAGGATGGGAGASGGGSAGAPLAASCKELVKIGSPLQVQSSDKQYKLIQSQLSALDDEHVGVSLGMQSIGPVVFRKMQFGSLEPWKTWPVAAPTVVFDASLNPLMYAATGQHGGLDVLARTASSGPSELRWLRPIAPGGGGPGAAVISFKSAYEPRFLVSLGTSQVVGIETGLSLGKGGAFVTQARGYHLDLTTFTATPIETTLGCGNGLLSFDAAPRPGGGSFVVSSSAVIPPGCDVFDEPPEAQTKLLVYRQDKTDVTLVSEIETGQKIFSARIFARSDGAWLVYQLGQSNNVGPLTAQRLDTDGKLVGQPTELLNTWAGSPDKPGFPAVARLGDRLIVMGRGDIQTASLIVSVFGDDGLSSPLSLYLPTSASITSTTLLGAPSADRLLAGWEEPGVAPNSGLFLQRIDCAQEAP